jgi:predicted ArsR family transcriptional regulator
MGHGARNYKLLANMLAGFVNAGLRDPQAGAELAGRGWGGYLSAPVRPHPGDPVDLRSAAEMILRMMDRLGFEPELKEVPDAIEVHLHHCPFRDVAARYPQTVCAMHLGILRGALTDVHAGAEATELLPFVTPSLCVAKLERPTDPSSN